MIQEDVYELLTLLKGDKKSYNDVIKELIQKNSDLEVFFGIIDDEKAELMSQAVKKLKQQPMNQSKKDHLHQAWES